MPMSHLLMSLRNASQTLTIHIRPLQCIGLEH